MARKVISIPPNPVTGTLVPGSGSGYANVPCAVAGRTTIVATLSASWTALPAIGLANRKTIRLTNIGSDSININFGTPLANEGAPLHAGSWLAYDVTESIPIYGRATAGTPSVAVEELS